MAKQSKNKFGPYKGYYPQKYLYGYLNIEIDPYDFPHRMLVEWGRENDVEIGDDEHADSLTEKQLKDYEEWLAVNHKDAEFLQDDPSGAPAYLTLKWPKKMPKGTWAIHFTKEGGFTSFEYGATIETLALSTWFEKKEKVRCPANLSDELGTMEYVYIFAFEAKRYPLSYGSRKYGKNAVLFQTDAAIEAHHIGDEEQQLIVPACSEYNVIPLRGVDEGIIACSFENEEEGLEFETVEALISYIESEEKKGLRPLARLKC